jgi:hypothetical protein
VGLYATLHNHPTLLGDFSAVHRSALRATYGNSGTCFAQNSDFLRALIRMSPSVKAAFITAFAHKIPQKNAKNVCISTHTFFAANLTPS